MKVKLCTAEKKVLIVELSARMVPQIIIYPITLIKIIFQSWNLMILLKFLNVNLSFWVNKDGNKI